MVKTRIINYDSNHELRKQVEYILNSAYELDEDVKTDYVMTCFNVCVIRPKQALITLYYEQAGMID